MCTTALWCSSQSAVLSGSLAGSAPPPAGLQVSLVGMASKNLQQDILYRVIEEQTRLQVCVCVCVCECTRV